MSAILQPTSSDAKTAHGDRLRIAQQRVDYLVCTNCCEVVAIVELDDRPHSQAKDQLRDVRLEQAGIRTIRFQARAKPKVDAIRTAILGPAADDVKSPIEPSRAAVPALGDAGEMKSAARKPHPTQRQVASSQD